MAHPSSAKPLIVFLLIALMMVSTPYTASALSCSQALGKIAPCLPYLINSANTPSSSCCNGVSSLNKALTTTKSRQDACTCLKSRAQKLSSLNRSRVSSLPSKCHVHLPFSIGVGINCRRSVLNLNHF